ncbi:MAG: hypothetical protein EGR00_01980 [Prevotella sp.]|nr:hypothetical protein [Prevotella sp.]
MNQKGIRPKGDKHPFGWIFFVFAPFQSVTIAIFYIYFVVQMNHISDFLCIFAQNLRKVIEMSRK